MTIMRSLRAAVTCGCSYAAIALTTALSAQTPELPLNTDGEEAAGPDSSVIVVTGSRLERDPNDVAPSPITSISAQDIQQTGVVDPAEALREIPALSQSGTIVDSIERGSGGVGQATLELRGLGANRTLVLVNGKRHVAGVAGSQIVDVATIPTGLIESVEVLTGGASAVYGADAVTGVVNYILKEDFEGISASGQVGLSEEGDGFTGSADLTIGRNFAEGRGNITLSGGYSRIEELQMEDRSYAANNRIANAGLTYGSPDLRFQKGDISASSTPSFFDYFTVDNGLYPYGFSIPLPGSETYDEIFGGRAPTGAEQALIDRALAAPSNAFEAFPAFAISSNSGLVFRNDFGFFQADVNGNGIQDCEESFIGFTGFGGGGCYVTTEGGGVRIFEDGTIATATNQFGGDGAGESNSPQSLIPENERYYINLRTSFEVSSTATLFFDGKYARSDTVTQNPYNTFYDSLLIRPDNPFIPAVLQADADDAGGLRVSRDFTDLGPGFTEADRETYRFVVGIEGEMTEHLDYELYANYGHFKSDVTFSNSVLYDRLFAALDAVDEGQFLTGTPNGNIVCRSDLDGGANPYPGSEIFPVIEPGFFTFNPGDGQCAPITLFNGAQSVSQAGVDFITTPTTNKFELDQFVVAASLTGDLGTIVTLQGGAPQFAVGVEMRKEESTSRFNDFTRGILKIDTIDGSAGDFIGDISGNQALDFDASTRTFNSGGEYSVFDAFTELNLPILSGRPFFESLELAGAARFSDYSTVGQTFTWNVNGIWAPVPDIRFRATYAQAVRAPNIAELFDPAQGTVFRPIDPCDVNQIQVLRQSDPARADIRQANCLADGAPAGYTDPLTARFPGTTGGNPDLREETAKTWTAGVVLQPRFLPGLSLSADYYNIRIKDAVGSVSAQDIVDQCYDSATFPNQFCGQFDRRSDFGLAFLRQTQLNFGRIETAGVDATAIYRFGLGRNDFTLRTNVGWVDKLDYFFDPANPDAVDPELSEQGRPEWQGTFSAAWQNGPFSLRYGLQYLDSMALRGVEIETADVVAGPRGFAKEYFIHDATVGYEFSERMRLYAGVNNISDEKPFRNSSAYPVSPYGRYYFLGLSVQTANLF
ncbi:TonB-dependent receptor domain-containing protein [Pacificimonas flava]|nr:TonB-dependent receptor [Pacificimonas flava]MBB5280778.1 outer membrane receptor protein involved in Fe transport [Pacificimonas flava]